jgi:hypothetical protein
MRLSWPFRRSASDGASVAAAAWPVQRAAAPVRHDWRETGALRPSFAADPGIRVQRFGDELAGHQLPAPILAPLGHERSADGPGGLISGLARPTIARTVAGSGGRAELPLRPRRRGRNAVGSEAWEGPTAPAEPMMSDGPGSPPAEVASPEPLPSMEPRHALVVPTSAVRGGRLTVARTPDLALAPPGRATQERPAAVPAPAPTVPGTAWPGPAATGAGPAATVRPSSADAERATTPAPAVTQPATVAPIRTILRSAARSRVRLGPPIQRDVLDASAPRDLALRTRPSGPPDAPAAHGAAAATPTGEPVTGSDAPLAGGLTPTIEQEPLASATPTTSGPGIPGGLVLARVVASRTAEPRHPGAAPPDETPATTPFAALAPLVGSEPLGPLAGLRPTVPPPGTAPAPSSTRTATVRVAQRASVPSAGAQSADGRSVPWAGSRTRTSTAVATTHRGAGPPRSADTVGAPAPAEEAGPTLALQLQRRAASVPPPPSAVSAAPPIAGSSVIDRADPLVLARTTTQVVAQGNDLRPMRAPRGGDRNTIAGWLPIQRAADGSATDATAEPAAAASTPASTTGGGPDTSSGAGTAIADRDLDEMVRRLYPRLRRSLSSELVVARERAGSLADLR